MRKHAVIELTADSAVTGTIINIIEVSDNGRFQINLPPDLITYECTEFDVQIGDLWNDGVFTRGELPVEPFITPQQKQINNLQSYTVAFEAELDDAITEVTRRLTAGSVVDGKFVMDYTPEAVYNPEFRYLKGESVTDDLDNNLYQALKAVKGVQPSTNPDKWLNISSSGYPDWDSYDLDYYFKVDDIVSRNGSDYICKEPHSKNEMNAPDSIPGKSLWKSYNG